MPQCWRLPGCGPGFAHNASRKAFAVADGCPYMGRILIPLYRTVRSSLVEERFGPALFGFLAIVRSTSEEAAQLTALQFNERPSRFGREQQESAAWH